MVVFVALVSLIAQRICDANEIDYDNAPKSENRNVRVKDLVLRGQKVQVFP